jgi:hypothetical protein
MWQLSQGLRRFLIFGLRGWNETRNPKLETAKVLLGMKLVSTDSQEIYNLVGRVGGD